MAENWQETAQMYEQLFQKPKMTEKLLCKPPFRYLHDIFSATLKQTNFGAGLFTGDELNSKSFEDKDSKLGFLVKLITLTEMVIQEKLEIKPGMILAGQQSDKTNEWLQNMFRAATAGVDTEPYVAEILGQVGEVGEVGDGQEAEAEAIQQEQEDDGQAQAEAAAEQAQRQAQEDAEMQQRAELERAEKDKRKTEKKRKQKQSEEEERTRIEKERQDQEDQMRHQMEVEEQQMLQQQQMETDMMMDKQNQQQLIREGEDQEEDDRAGLEQQEQVDPENFEGRGGALVQEAKALLQQDEEEAPKETENAGPKIKMNRIKRNKRGAAPGKEGDEKSTKKTSGAAADAYRSVDKPSGQSGSFTEQDIEFMKKAIQVLCQSTNPLGKSIDFVTDDIDSMSKEFEYWKKESQSCSQKLVEQQKITEEVLQPLQDQLAELEEKIREQTSKVNSIKSQIMTNDITVQNLLFSVISSK